MGSQPRHSAARQLANRQHGVITRAQLFELGFTRKGIEHRLRTGRLRRLHPSIYAVLQLKLSRETRWMAAVLCCGDGALLRHPAASALWGIEDRRSDLPSISVPAERDLRPEGIRVHRVRLEPRDRRALRGIPVTSPARTLIDLAANLGAARSLTETAQRRLEAAVNAADRLGRIDPETLREEVESRPGLRGVPALRRVLDEATFVLTESELERRFLRLARRAGLPRPETQVRIGAYRVDFLWRELGLVVETDGLRYHRTAARQERDSRRDQAMITRGLRPMRISHSQVEHDPDSVVRALRDVARLLWDTE